MQDEVLAGRGVAAERFEPLEQPAVEPVRESEERAQLRGEARRQHAERFQIGMGVLVAEADQLDAAQKSHGRMVEAVRREPRVTLRKRPLRRVQIGVALLVPGGIAVGRPAVGLRRLEVAQPEIGAPPAVVQQDPLRQHRLQEQAPGEVARDERRRKHVQEQVALRAFRMGELRFDVLQQLLRSERRIGAGHDEQFVAGRGAGRRGARVSAEKEDEFGIGDPADRLCDTGQFPVVRLWKVGQQCFHGCGAWVRGARLSRTPLCGADVRFFGGYCRRACRVRRFLLILHCGFPANVLQNILKSK